MLGTMTYDDFEWVSTTGEKLPPGKRAFAKVSPLEVASSLHLFAHAGSLRRLRSEAPCARGCCSASPEFRFA